MNTLIASLRPSAREVFGVRPRETGYNSLSNLMPVGAPPAFFLRLLPCALPMARAVVPAPTGDTPSFQHGPKAAHALKESDHGRLRNAAVGWFYAHQHNRTASFKHRSGRNVLFNVGDQKYGLRNCKTRHWRAELFSNATGYQNTATGAHERSFSNTPRQQLGNGITSALLATPPRVFYSATGA